MSHEGGAIKVEITKCMSKASALCKSRPLLAPPVPILKRVLHCNGAISDVIHVDLMNMCIRDLKCWQAMLFL